MLQNINCVSALIRVSYRENELRKRHEEKRLLEQQKIEEEVERENRLEKLREQVGWFFVKIFNETWNLVKLCRQQKLKILFYSGCLKYRHVCMFCNWKTV